MQLQGDVQISSKLSPDNNTQNQIRLLMRRSNYITENTHNGRGHLDSHGELEFE